MSSGRTYWWAKDSGWWRRELVVTLGEEFGPLGPAVLDWLSCEAKAQNAGGVVKTGARTLARGVFADVGSVCPVLSRLSQLGGLDDFEQGEVTFTCRISGWKSDQDRGREAARKAEQRARKNAESSTDTEDHVEGHDGTDGDMSHVVPPSPRMSPTGQDRRGTETTDVVSDKREPRKTVDQDSLPPDLPADLAAAAVAAHSRLLAVFDERGGTKPSLRAVGLAVRRYPDRDHDRVLGELEHWALAGLGQRRPVRDWAKTLATFLERAPAGKAPALGTAPVGVMDNGLAERTARRRAIIEGGAA